MIISKVDISKDKEITVPFEYPLDSYRGYVECACGLNSCVFKTLNSEWIESNKITKCETTEEKYSEMPLLVTDENSTNKNELSITPEQQHESEAELNAASDESKHEKLSREERKLQAYLKQFEKLEKKDTVKKVKEPKTPVPK